MVKRELQPPRDQEQQSTCSNNNCPIKEEETPMEVSKEEAKSPGGEEEEEDQPLDMSKTSSTIKHRPVAESVEQAQLFSGLHLLRDIAVGILEAERRQLAAQPALA